MYYFALTYKNGTVRISSLPKSKVSDEEAKSTEILLTALPSEYEIYLKNNHRQTTTQERRSSSESLCLLFSKIKEKYNGVPPEENPLRLRQVKITAIAGFMYSGTI
ncbi:hypothetical protein CEXT_503001 [Caerostris extrusa]|uniref:LAGLIDADG homing endonuclease n=1 Tax=Caerostris extrusa TaxID=172846 RepID=A0AAV4V947_CAEEX|nr:hypothetical protein CEXT_503001 [Caerostris extrusa]